VSGTPEDAPPPSARDLVRRRTRYRAPDTGRRHHIGAAPEAVPVHTEDGVARTRVTSWQLADRTPVQLRAQRAATDAQMRRAAGDLDFESAARLRDELASVDAELATREGQA
jgi:excinuclease UvrABC helicase subunit UvrB